LPSQTPEAATLVIHQYGVAITLPPDVADATYAIDSSWAGSWTDATGAPFTEDPAVIIWTTSLAADPACSGGSALSGLGLVTQYGLVQIQVFPADPSNLTIADGPWDIKHIGQYWFGINEEQAPNCTDLNPNETPEMNSLVQAYDTLHAA
jgi:hypothetical protein